MFVEAAKKYREALTQRDHPGIHYNLALALLNLDRPLEVHQQLESALKYSREPLDPDGDCASGDCGLVAGKNICRAAPGVGGASGSGGPAGSPGTGGLSGASDGGGD